LSRLSDTHFFKKRFTNIPICICGYPKYQSSWLRTISNNNKKVAASKKIIFVAYKGFNKKKYYKDKYLKQLHSLFDIAFRNNYKLVFKFHPNEQEEKVFLSVAQSYPKELYSITKDYLYDAAKKSDIFISFYNNASILDGLCANLTPIELSNIFLKKQVSLFTKFKLSLFCKNGTEIEKTIKNIIKKKINKKNIKKNFSKIIISKNAIQKTSDFISKISGL
jgi:hypothetical protein